MIKKLSELKVKEFDISLLPAGTKPPLANLIQDMIHKGIITRTVRIKDVEKINLFLKDVEPLQKWISVKRNPIDEMALEIRLTNKAQDYILF